MIRAAQIAVIYTFLAAFFYVWGHVIRWALS